MLEGKVALVAGATRGAGRGIAVELGAAGATVYCTGRTTAHRALGDGPAGDHRGDRGARRRRWRPRDRRARRPPRARRGAGARRPHRARAGRASTSSSTTSSARPGSNGTSRSGSRTSPTACARCGWRSTRTRSPATSRSRCSSDSQAGSSSRSTTAPPSTTTATTGCRFSTTSPKPRCCAWRSRWGTSCGRTARRPCH